ncbi:MAG: sulfatase-like hydrolase/transferase [Candidatus Binatia bacterium]
MANVLLRVSALLAVAFALALLYLRLPESGARGERVLCERCNVVLISFDTVRADHLGAYGYERPTSPNVDALASKSQVFDRAISQAPWTLPAHGSMLSGLYPSRLGVLRYPATRSLPDKNPVLPEMFRAAGYKTAGFTGGGFVSDHYGFGRGFDVYQSRGRRFEHNLDDTIDWLDQNKREPFFLFVHGYDAHRPYYSKSADKTALGMSASVDADQGRFCLSDDRAKPDDARLEKIVRYYDASIHHGDRAIGVLLETLEQLKLMDNTIILLTSDHGEEFFEHGNCDHVRFLYEESVHVPYILYVPRLVEKARHHAGLTPASISVARTLLDAVGIEHAMPGVTLLPMIHGDQNKGFPVVYSEADSAAGSLGSRGRTTAITKNEIKLISYTEEGTDEAYDLAVDPRELEPLPERSPAYLLRQSLRAWMASMRALPRPDKPRDKDAEKAARDSGTEEYAEPESPEESAGSKRAEPGAVTSPTPSPSPAGSVGASRERPAASAKKERGGRKPDRSSSSSSSKKAAPGDEEEEMEVPKELEEDLRSLGYLE